MTDDERDQRCPNRCGWRCVVRLDADRLKCTRCGIEFDVTYRTPPEQPQAP